MKVTADHPMTAGSRKEATTAAVELTMSAARKVRDNGLQPAVDALEIGAEFAVGDLVTLSVGETETTFAIIRRRWIIGPTVRFEITLDYPARGGR